MKGKEGDEMAKKKNKLPKYLYRQQERRQNNIHTYKKKKNIYPLLIQIQ